MVCMSRLSHTSCHMSLLSGITISLGIQWSLYRKAPLLDGPLCGHNLYALSTICIVTSLMWPHQVMWPKMFHKMVGLMVEGPLYRVIDVWHLCVLINDGRKFCCDFASFNQVQLVFLSNGIILAFAGSMSTFSILEQICIGCLYL